MDPYLSRVSAALQRAFPALHQGGPLNLLGEGFGSLAVETPAGMVFRIARTAQSGARYAREALALPALKPYLPVAIPEPNAYLPGNADFAYGVIGYPRLPGTPLEPDSLTPETARCLAGQVGAVLAAFQRVPVAGFPLRDDFTARRAAWQEQWHTARPALRAALAPEEFKKVAAWWADFLEDETMRAYTPVVQHGDLWFGNFLTEGARIVALLDFEEVGVGDPALDFVSQLYLGERFLRWVMEAFENAGGAAEAQIEPEALFEPDALFAHRLLRLWALREFGGLVYSIEQNDRAEFADALEKIRKGPILHPSGLDGWRRFD
jgi:aminoglycoside 2''-phosphotransferase